MLGAGGFGRVYLVADEYFNDEPRALKVILPRHSENPEFGERFRNEILILRALAHDGIPQIFNDGRTPAGEYYYTMAFVEGVTLSQVLKEKGSLPPERVVRIVKQILDVLEYAHEHGVVHRDLKPANIMLINAGTPDELVKVLDFGIAKVIQKEGMLESAQTFNTGGMVGTAPFMSPEQVRGKEVDGSSDLYALGLVIYVMCSGNLPFTGTTVEEIATARLVEPPPPLPQDAAPPWLEKLMMRLLEREREARPDVAEVRRRLDAQQRMIRHLVFSGGLLAVAVLSLLAWQFMAHREGAHVGGARRGGAGDERGGEVANEHGSDGGGADTLAPALRNVAVKFSDGSALFAVDAGHYLLRDEKRLVVDGLVEEAHPKSLTVELDGQPVEAKSNPDGSFRAELELSAGASHSLALVAQDEAGNETRAPAITLERDLAPPTIDFADAGAAGAGLRTRAASIKIEVEVRDAHLTAEPATATLNDPAGETRPALLVREGGGEATRFHATLDLAMAGRFTLAVHARDAVGNEASASLRIERLAAFAVASLEPQSGAKIPASQRQLEVAGAANDALRSATLRRKSGGDALPATVAGSAFRATVALDSGGNEFEWELVAADGGIVKLPWSVELLAPALPAGPFAAIEPFDLSPDGFAKVVRHAPSGIEFLLVAPPGLAPIYVSRCETTWANLNGLAKSEPAASDLAALAASAKEGEAELPAVRMTAAQAEQWAGRVSPHARLPTAAEWRALVGPGRFPWGDVADAARCRCADASGKSSGAWAVRESAAKAKDLSPFGIVGLAGNVSEWCRDGKGGFTLRGGSYDSDIANCAADFVPPIVPEKGMRTIGFRIVIPQKE